jgi:hypothetical protein
MFNCLLNNMRINIMRPQYTITLHKCTRPYIYLPNNQGIMINSPTLWDYLE